MRKKSKKNIHDITCRQCNHIANFLSKISVRCSMELNKCGWCIRDKADVNYTVYEAYQKIDYYERRIAWVMKNIKKEDETGCNVQIDFQNIVHSLIHDLTFTNAITKVLIQYRGRGCVSAAEEELFRHWLCCLKTKLINYISNKKNSQSNSDYKERTIKKLTNEVKWAIKSKPKDIPENLAKMMVFEYRYAQSSYSKLGLENFQKINYDTRNYNVETFVVKMVEEELKNNFRK